MATSGTAFKTTDPAITNAWRTAEQQFREIGGRAVAEAVMIGKNKGLMVQRSLGDEEFVGLAPIDPDDPPEGWRYVRSQFEPRRGAPGEQARAWLKSIRRPSLRDVMASYGLPKIVFGHGRMTVPAMELHGDTIWVLYSIAPSEDEIGPAWERCKVSEFYAAQEASQTMTAGLNAAGTA